MGVRKLGGVRRIYNEEEELRRHVVVELRKVRN